MILFFFKTSQRSWFRFYHCYISWFPTLKSSETSDSIRLVKINIYPILEPMHVYIINLVFCAWFDHLWLHKWYYVSYNHDNCHFFSLCLLWCENMAAHYLWCLKSKFTDCHLIVNNQQRSMNNGHMFNMYNKIIIYFSDRSMRIAITWFLRGVTLRSLCIWKIELQSYIYSPQTKNYLISHIHHVHRMILEPLKLFLN